MPEQNIVQSEMRPWWKSYGAALAVLGVAALVASFFVIQNVRANADYICTHIIDESGECANGAWSSWQTTSTSDDPAACARTTVQQRTYTGTRIINHILQYLNLRTACDAGYTQQQVGNSGGASGFHGGTIITESSACQIVQTQTTRAPLNTGVCTPTITTTTSFDSSQIDIGGPNQNTQNIGGISDLTAFRRSMIKATILAKPPLVHIGDTSVITWTGREVSACTVAGSNGDGTGSNSTGSWSGTSGEKPSSPLNQRTTYTLTCTAFDGTPVPPQQAVVDMLPVFQEQ